MNITKMAARIRNRIKKSGIKARVRVAPGGGFVQVNAPAFDAKFNEEEQYQIRLIAKVHGMTYVRGEEIDLIRMTNPETFSFYLP